MTSSRPLGKFLPRAHATSRLPYMCFCHARTGEHDNETIEAGVQYAVRSIRPCKKYPNLLSVASKIFRVGGIPKKKLRNTCSHLVSRKQNEYVQITVRPIVWNNIFECYYTFHLNCQEFYVLMHGQHLNVIFIVN
jgi:hypothetical protein